jgi:hypothetical protein
MLSTGRKSFLGTSTALVVVALVAAMVVAAVASAGARSADAQPAGAKPPPGGPAVAKPLKYVMADSPPVVGPERTYKAVAQCPNFYLAISGGFDLHNPPSFAWPLPGSYWSIRASRPATSEEANPETAWVVEADGGNRRPFTAYAVCVHESLVPRGDALYYASSYVPIPEKGARELRPGCQATHQAIGGGFGFGKGYNYNRQLIRTKLNNPRSWSVMGYNDARRDSDSPLDLSAYVVCIREDLVKDRRYLTKSSWDKGVLNSGTPRCPENTYLLSGGGSVPEQQNETDINWSHIRPGGGSEADPPKDWAVGAIDTRLFRFSTLMISSHAICGRLGSKSLGGEGGKLSGKNPGWGDGMGGGRFKK